MTAIADDIPVVDRPIKSSPVRGEVEGPLLGIAIGAEKRAFHNRSFRDGGQCPPPAGATGTSSTKAGAA